MAVQHPVKPAPGVVAPAHLPAEGSAAFNNVHYVVLVLLAPKLVQWGLPFLAGRTLYLVLFVVLFLPVTIAYWWAASNWGARLDDKVKLPGKPIGDYLEFKDDELRREYLGRKIPYQVLHDAYFDDKVAFKGASGPLLLAVACWPSSPALLEVAGGGCSVVASSQADTRPALSAHAPLFSRPSRPLIASGRRRARRARVPARLCLVQPDADLLQVHLLHVRARGHHAHAGPGPEPGPRALRPRCVALASRPPLPRSSSLTSSPRSRRRGCMRHSTKHRS